MNDQARIEKLVKQLTKDAAPFIEQLVAEGVPDDEIIRMGKSIHKSMFNRYRKPPKDPEHIGRTIFRSMAELRKRKASI